jgi:hypothetical protein
MALADIADIIEAWTGVVAAERLLSAAIEAYRAQHQNPLLDRASEAFAMTTGGAFSGISLDYDDADSHRIVAVRPGGARLAIDKLSEGTADQLFLALRIATIEDHARRARPLPFIADDLFVTFDDTRTKAGLTLLADLGRTTQAIVFTHHQHVVEAARHALGPAVDTIDRCAFAVGLACLFEQMGGMAAGLVHVTGLFGGFHGPGDGAVTVRLLGKHGLVLGQGFGKLVVVQQDIGQKFAGRQDRAGRDDMLFSCVLARRGLLQRTDAVLCLAIGAQRQRTDDIGLDVDLLDPVGRSHRVSQCLQPLLLLPGRGGISTAGRADAAGKRVDRLGMGILLPRIGIGRRLECELRRLRPVAALERHPGRHGGIGERGGEMVDLVCLRACFNAFSAARSCASCRCA